MTLHWPPEKHIHPLSARLATKERGLGVLVDGCHRCAEHAEHPLVSLDKEHIVALWREMVLVEATDQFDGVYGYRSLLDAQAAVALRAIAGFIRRFLGSSRTTSLEAGRTYDIVMPKR